MSSMLVVTWPCVQWYRDALNYFETADLIALSSSSPAMVRWTLALLTVVTLLPWSRSRRDHLPDPELTYGADLGHEIHPNRHRHHAHDIFIAGFFPTSPGHAETSIGQGVMPAVKLALHDVNRSPTILPNHHLRMHWNNTAVSSKFHICHVIISKTSETILFSNIQAFDNVVFM